MECPTCGVPGLIGAVNCMACGGSLFPDRGHVTGPAGVEPKPETVALFPDRKAFPWEEETDATRPLDFDVAAVLAAPRPASLERSAAGAGGTKLCGVCMTPFEVVPGSPSAVCHPCSPDAAVDTGPLPGGALPYPAHDERGVRLDPVANRPAPRAKLRSGVVALLAGILIVGTAGVVTVLEPEADPFADALLEVRPANAVLRVLVPGKKSFRFETRSDLRVAYETAQAGSSDLAPRLDAQTETVAVTELALVDRRSAGDLVHATSDCRADVQIVRVGRGREVNRDVYPWDGHKGDVRVYLPPSGQPAIAGGGVPVPGRDLPPLVNLSATGARPGEVQPGAEWASRVPLPLLADREGRVSVHGFEARFTYVGRLAAHGHECLVVRMRAYVGKPLPPTLRRMDRVRGMVHGLLHFDSRTGLLVRGDLRADLTLSRTKGGGGERLEITGRVIVTSP